MGGWVGMDGWMAMEEWKLRITSAKFEVEVEAELGNKLGLSWAKLSSDWNWNFGLLLLIFV